MAATDTPAPADNAVPDNAVQPTVSTNSVVDPAITIIDPATQKVTEVTTAPTTRVQPSDALVNDPMETHNETPVTVQGEPNGLPPSAPTVQLQPPPEVKALREWEHLYLRNSIHSADEDHLHVLHQHIEAICAKLHSKWPTNA